MSDRFLLERLRAVEQRVRVAVAQRRQADPQPDDPFRGLYLTDEVIDALLASDRYPYQPPEPAAPPPGDSRLGALAKSARLTDLDIELLLIAVAPDVDSRFEQFYGYLNDDVTRRRAGTGLALRLCGLPEASPPGRARLAAGAPLVDLGLLTVEDSERPFLSRFPRPPDRLVGYLLGNDDLDPLLAACARLAPQLPIPLPVTELEIALRREVRLAYLTERNPGSAAAYASHGLQQAGLAALDVDARKLAGQPDVVAALAREAVLRRAGVVLGPLTDEALAGGVLDGLYRAAVPVLGYGTQPWNPQWSVQVPLQLEVPALLPGQRRELWSAALTAPPSAEDPVRSVVHLSLGAEAIVRAAQAASLYAAVDGGKVTVAHVRAGARSQNATGLLRLARRIEPVMGWHDLVLPGEVLGKLRELAARARHRDRVLDEWRMRPGGGRGRGVAALFAGDSGTGKTMSAEVMASELGMDLYAVNLATVVDKYVGETEKNLEQIFHEAAGVNGVLLFDEADAIFGKRSEVRDAHDRYANIESAYLLQRMEAFDGLAVLATNLRANLDDAFTRRLDMVIDFPIPDEKARRALWDRCLGSIMPRDSDVDLDFLAESFELAGGNIRSAAVTAAYLAAADGRPARMADLIGAVAREYQKLGRLCLEREFGPYLKLVVT